MAGGKTFTACMGFLVFCNVISFLIGRSPLLNVSVLITTLVSIAAIAILIGKIPLTGDADSTTKWFVTSVIILAILFNISFDINLLVYTWPVSIGIGLASNMISLFSSNPSDVGYLGYLFFWFIGIIGFISGEIMTATGGD